MTGNDYLDIKHMHTSSTISTSSSAPASRFPLSALLALAMAGFITILTEALPAGLLLAMATDLGVSEAMVGQLVTMYAVGSLIAAIPIVLATQGWRRKPLLLLAIGGFAIVNTITAVSTSYVLTMIARLFAGVFAGLLWALIVGYAARMVPAHQKGRAIAIAMVGTPLALSLGIPAGTLLGNLIGWQYTFALMSAMTIMLVIWVVLGVPDFPGQEGRQRFTIMQTLGIAGVKPVLCVILLFVLGHNILYTYIAPFLVPSGMAAHTDLVLLAFGTASLVGIWIVGTKIDRYLRELVIASILLFIAATLILLVAPMQPAAIVTAIIAWGLAFGGVPTLFQTALADAAGNAADVAQSILVTTWNTGIAAAGFLGGILLNQTGASSFPWALLACSIPALIVAVFARQHGFTART